MILRFCFISFLFSFVILVSITDLINIPYSSINLGPSYIRPNQSVFYPVDIQHKQIESEHDDIMKKIKNCFGNRHDSAHIPLNVSIYKLYSNCLRTCLTHRYIAPLPLRDQIRALRELKIVKSIRRKLKKYKLVLRETDKSGVLHIGRMKDYERKAVQYRQETRAYEELSYNPFNDIIITVTRLINQLRINGQIYEWQKKKLTPVRNKTELSYKYFVPKPHKVIVYIYTYIFKLIFHCCV